MSPIMTEPDVTRALGKPRAGRPRVRASAVVLSLVWSASACGRLGYDLLPRDDDPDEGGGRGGASSSGASGASGSVGGSAGSDGTAGEGGAPIDNDGGGVAGAGGGGTGGGGTGGAGAGGAGDGGAGGSASLATCTDGAQNGDELGTDCGGSDCVPCACAFAAPEVLGNPNYPGNLLWGPSLSADASTLYVAVVVPGVSEQIAVCTRPDRGNTFDLANLLAAPVNQSVEGTPHISLDGLSLYFFSERGGSGRPARDLYVATRSDPNGTFDTASPLASVNSSTIDHLPWSSADELTLYFSSQRGGSTLDIWRSSRASRAQAFGAPAAVPELNSSADENGVTLTLDERTVILASNRPNGAGGYDLYQAVRAATDQPFSTPEPLTALNTSANEVDASLSPDGQELFFVSTRNGANEIWRSIRSCP